MSNLWPPVGYLRFRMAVNVSQHKIVNLKLYEIFFVIMCCNVFNVWPKTTLLVWRRDAKRLDTPVNTIFFPSS